MSDSDCECAGCEVINNKNRLVSCVRYVSIDKAKTRVAVLKTELSDIETNYKRVIDHLVDMKPEMQNIVDMNHRMFAGMSKMRDDVNQLTTANEKLEARHAKLTAVT